MIELTYSKVDKFDFSFEKVRVDLIPKCVLGDGKLKLFPDTAAVDPVLGLKQAESDLGRAIDELPDVRAPASTVR